MRDITKPSSVLFKSDAEFQAYNDACKFLRDAGFSYGSMERGAPIGFMHGDHDIAKWRNLSEEDRMDMHGEMNADARSFRLGPVYVDLYDSAPQEARDAFVAAAERLAVSVPSDGGNRNG